MLVGLVVASMVIAAFLLRGESVRWARKEADCFHLSPCRPTVRNLGVELRAWAVIVSTGKETPCLLGQPGQTDTQSFD